MNVTSPTASLERLEYAACSAASEVGVRTYNLRDSGKGIAFTLKTGEPNELREDWRGKQRWQAKYQRLSQRTKHSTDKRHPGIEFNPVVPGAVCWQRAPGFLESTIPARARCQGANGFHHVSRSAALRGQLREDVGRRTGQGKQGVCVVLSAVPGRLHLRRRGDLAMRDSEFFALVDRAKLLIEREDPAKDTLEDENPDMLPSEIHEVVEEAYRQLGYDD